MGIEFIPPPVRPQTRPEVLDTFEAWCLDIRDLLYSEYLNLPIKPPIKQKMVIHSAGDIFSIQELSYYQIDDILTDLFGKP